MSDFDFSDERPKRRAARRRAGPPDWVLAPLILLPVLAVCVAVFLLNRTEKPRKKVVQEPAVLAGRWTLEDDPTGGLVIVDQQDAHQIAILSHNGERAVIMRFHEEADGLLTCVTLDDPASGAPPGVRHEIRYAFEGGKLILWHAGQRLTYVRQKDAPRP